MLIPDRHVQTNTGTIPLDNGDNVLFLDACEWQGRLFVAGQSHQGRGVILWDGQKWQIVQPPPTPNNTVLFDSSGFLHIAIRGDAYVSLNLTTGERSQPKPLALGSQGFAYMGPSGPVPMDQARGSAGLAEVQVFGDVAIGQGMHGGAVVVHGAERRVVQAGNTLWVRGNRDGERLALATWIPKAQVELHWFDLSVLAAYPREVAPQPPPVQPPPVPQPPLPSPEPPAMEFPNHRFIAEQLDREFPHLIQQNTRESCTEFMWRLMTRLHGHDAKWGFLSKREHDNHVVIGGQRVSIDAIAYKGIEDRIMDVLKAAGDGPGKGGLFWGEDERREIDKWVMPPPFPSEPQPQPNPQPNPPPPPPPDSSLEQRMSALTAIVSQTRAELEATRAVLSTHTGLIAELQNRQGGNGVQPGHPVSVSGRVSFSDVLNSRTVTWDGKVK